MSGNDEAGIPIEDEVWELYILQTGLPMMTLSGKPRGESPILLTKAGEKTYKRATERAKRFVMLSKLFQGIADPEARMTELLNIEAGAKAIAGLADRVRTIPRAGTVADPRVTLKK